MGRPKNTTGQQPLITAREAEAMKDDLEKLKEMAGAGEIKDTGYSATAQIDDLAIDKEGIRRKIDVLNRQLDAHKNQRVTDNRKRDELYARRKALEDKFGPYLESFRDLGVVRRDDPDWGPAYKKAMKRHEVEHYISEWRRIGIMLEPNDSDINNLDNLRSK
jgi:hypothetical protein